MQSRDIPALVGIKGFECFLPSFADEYQRASSDRFGLHLVPHHGNFCQGADAARKCQGGITLIDQGNQPLPPDQLVLVRRFSQSLLQRQPDYRCKNCGFSGKTLMWQCPSCRSWGTIKPIIQAQREEA